MLAVRPERARRSAATLAPVRRGKAGADDLLLATSESRAPTRCDTRFADSTQLLTIVGGAASFVLVEKSRPAWTGGASRC